MADLRGWKGFASLAAVLLVLGVVPLTNHDQSRFERWYRSGLFGWRCDHYRRRLELPEAGQGFETRNEWRVWQEEQQTRKRGDDAET